VTDKSNPSGARRDSGNNIDGLAHISDTEPLTAVWSLAFFASLITRALGQGLQSPAANCLADLMFVGIALRNLVRFMKARSDYDLDWICWIQTWIFTAVWKVKDNFAAYRRRGLIGGVTIMVLSLLTLIVDVCLLIASD
jgi:hypothetical protein